MPKLANIDSSLRCSFGSLVTRLPRGEDSILIEGQPLILINNTQVLNFGVCTSPNNPTVAAAAGAPQPCIPQVMGQWTDSNARQNFGLSYAVHDRSHLSCAYGGDITIAGLGGGSIITEERLGSSGGMPVGEADKGGTGKDGAGKGEVSEGKSGAGETGKAETGAGKRPEAQVQRDDEKSIRAQDVEGASPSLVAAIPVAGATAAVVAMGTNPVARFPAGAVQDPKPDPPVRAARKAKTCPFCGEPMDAKHSARYYDDETARVAESNADALGCAPLDGAGVGRYTTANHHLIPVNEVFNLFPDFVVLATKCGFDINDPRNGIALPMCSNPYKKGKTTVNFGDMDEEYRKEIAYIFMRETGKQWHVGGHSYDDFFLEAMCYSGEVRKRVGKLFERLRAKKLCAGEDKRAYVRGEIYKLCAKLRTHLDAFAVDPRRSHPFYVSLYAAEFAGEDIEEEDIEGEDE